MTVDVDDFVFRARALAQSHPLTARARTYVDAVITEQLTLQPLPEIATWAQIALVNGYCVRRVEEEDTGLRPEELDRAPSGDHDLKTHVQQVVEALRTGDARPHILGDPDEVFATLNRIVRSEVERRLDQWRESILDDASDEVEEYITWWVVSGYALRTAEVAGPVESCAS
ncbi:MAG: hypothetical protein NVS3B12_14950 [Acidimicrobiales bacterium]